MDVLDTSVRELSQRANTFEQDQLQMRQDVERIQSQLAMAEATLPAFDMAALAVWDRPPDPHLYTIGAPSAIQPAEIKRALEPWINAAGVSTNDVELIGDVPARRFFLRVFGGQAATSRSLSLARNLRAGGQWRNFSAPNTTGALTPLYINADKS
eukprot:2336215-Pyramimonas_sp.AAC.1